MVPAFSETQIEQIKTIAYQASSPAQPIRASVREAVATRLHQRGRMESSAL